MKPTLLARICAALLATILIAMQPAKAQFSDSYNFLKAVKDRDGTKVTELLQGSAGASIINTKDYDNGDGALHIVARRRDDTWLRFLLAKGANPNLRNRDGAAPLHLAAQIGFVEGIVALIAGRADINLPNDRGETPLILAVQLRDIPSVRALLEAGANPDKADHIAGMSARDYAARDPRASSILKLITDAPKAKTPDPSKVAGPGL